MTPGRADGDRKRAAVCRRPTAGGNRRETALFEWLGIVFGGVSRLARHWMETREKQNERDHEARMFDQQIALPQQKIEAEKDLRQMDIGAQRDAGEPDALVTTIKARPSEATAAPMASARAVHRSRPKRPGSRRGLARRRDAESALLESGA